MVYDIRVIDDGLMILWCCYDTSIDFFDWGVSVHDGPGVRATAFLKGCPRRCEWRRNPEGPSFENEIVKSQTGCENCGACLKAGGGATFSGGEPLTQPDYLYASLALLEGQTHRAVQTSGCFTELDQQYQEHIIRRTEFLI